jgi:hypothetical protein
MSLVRKSDLSPARQRLVELMQQINFGQIEQLKVRGGDPVLQPSPLVTREVKLGSDDNAPRTKTGDFYLKPEVVDLFEQLDALGDGTVGRLEVRHGLPFKLVLPAEVKPVG